MATETLQNATKAGADFNAATLTRLKDDFRSLGGEAASLLSNFDTATAKMESRRNAFNISAKPVSTKPSVLSRLRSSEEMIALRQFAQAKEALIGHDADLGGKIAKHAEKKISLGI